MSDLVKRLREIGEIAIGAIQEPCGLVWHPANELLPAADRIEFLERENAALGLKLDTARMAVDELKKREARWITDFRKDANTLADIADRLWTELDRVEPENG